MLKRAPAQYELGWFQQFLNDVIAALSNRYEKRKHIDMDPATYIIMTSPNGTRYSITVSNAGAVVVTAV